MIGAVFVVFVICLVLGVPIAVSLLAAGLTASVVNPSFTVDAVFTFRTLSSSMDSYVLLAIPLFILSGNLMAKGGISDRLFTFFAYFLGNRTAGLPCAVIVSCLFYGAITGSAPATVAAIGAMTIPLLTRLGYDKVFVTALVAVAGGLGVIIPPSIPFVMYGVSSSTSVGDMFTAGIVPGLLIGACLMVCAWIMCKRNGEDKEKLAENTRQLHDKGFFAVFRESLLALICPVVILGGIYGGFFTPTEAACVSVIYALIVSVFIYKTMRWNEIVIAFRETALSLVSMVFVAAAATIFGRILTMMQIPQLVASELISTFHSKVALLLLINLFLLIVGMLMDAVSAILIVTPIFMPMIAAINVDPVHFGIIMVVNLAIGFVTPPVGVNLFVASTMSGVPIMKIAKKAIPFILFFLVALLAITFFEGISLCLL